MTPTESIKSTDELRQERLARGMGVSGALGVAKLLLLVAPFAVVQACSAAPTTFRGFMVAAVAIALPVPPFITFLLVPVSAVVVGVMAIASLGKQERTLARMAKWSVGLCSASLASLLLLGSFFWKDPDSTDRLLWGFWALLAADVATIVPLGAALLYPAAGKLKVEPEEAPPSASEGMAEDSYAN